jgi:DNA-binding NarL/FixJ family response regulator
MQTRINVAVLESQQGTVDGYTYRLNMVPEVKVVATCLYADELESFLGKEPINLLITGVDVYVSRNNRNPFPILYFISEQKKLYPGLKFLIISCVNHPQLIKELIEAGINGFILKDDQQSIQRLGNIVKMVADGGVYFSDGLMQNFFSKMPSMILTKRQLEVITLCAAYPDEDTYNLAKRLNISGSTLRNILSSTYEKLGVRTRTSAILKVRQMGIIPLGSPSENYRFEENNFGDNASNIKTSTSA